MNVKKGPPPKGKGGDKPKKETIRAIATNRKALFNYTVDEQLEVGIVLTGTEVKALRDSRLQLMDAYGTIERGEVYLIHAHIGEYTNRGYAEHLPTRARKLLLHRKEIAKLERKVTEKGMTLIPIEVYFKGSRVKVKLGVCRGKAAYDKRNTIKDRDEDRAKRRGDD